MFDWSIHKSRNIGSSILHSTIILCTIQLDWLESQKEKRKKRVTTAVRFPVFYSRERMKTFFLLDFEGVELLIGSSENSNESNPVMHLVDTSFCCFVLFMSSWSFSIFACISSITAVTSCFSTLLEGCDGDWSFNPSFVILLPPA